jgi:hypothetical protein
VLGLALPACLIYFAVSAKRPRTVGMGASRKSGGKRRHLD